MVKSLPVNPLPKECVGTNSQHIGKTIGPQEKHLVAITLPITSPQEWAIM